MNGFRSTWPTRQPRAERHDKSGPVTTHRLLLTFPTRHISTILAATLRSVPTSPVRSPLDPTDHPSRSPSFDISHPVSSSSPRLDPSPRPLPSHLDQPLALQFHPHPARLSASPTRPARSNRHACSHRYAHHLDTDPSSHNLTNLIRQPNPRHIPGGSDVRNSERQPGPRHP